MHLYKLKLSLTNKNTPPYLIKVNNLSLYAPITLHECYAWFHL